MEDLIIIIPTHNRQHYLRRVIKYYSEFPCKVYICDSSKEKADLESSGNIIYRWVPQSNFYGKVLDVLNETSADFYALSPDDDFLKQETLMECYDELKENEEYSFGIGKQYLFNKGDASHFEYHKGLNKLSGFNELSFSSKEVCMGYFWSHYQNILWSLFRRNVILRAFTYLKECNFNNGNFVETILGIEGLRDGKVYVSQNGLNYREYITEEHWGNTTQSITYDNIQKSNNLRKDLELFNKLYKGDSIASLWFSTYIACQKNKNRNLFVRIFNYLTKIVRMIIKSGGRTENSYIIRYIDSEMSKLISDAIES